MPSMGVVRIKQAIAAIDEALPGSSPDNRLAAVIAALKAIADHVEQLEADIRTSMN